MKIGNIVLDQEQVAIVEEKNSFLVVAGAGSGKTLTIIAKIKNMLLSGVNASDILVLAYTRNSAKEIEERLLKEGIIFKVYTFHSLAYKLVGKCEILSEDLLNFFKINFFKNDVLYLNYVKKHIKKKEELLFFQNDLVSLAEVLKLNYSKLKSKCRNREYYNLICEYKTCYENFLIENKLLDFNDLIIKATKKVTCDYKYIFIDEFQDISVVRFDLIKKIVKRNNSYLYCFGDDYQSIYKFSGSRVDYFIKFEKLSGINSKMYILNTYRNSQELLDIMSDFIRKNKKQIQKNLRSNKSINHPIVIIYDNFKNSLDYIFSDINNDETIFILARYNKYETLLKTYFKFQNEFYYYKEYKNKCKFLSVHKSKGLEASNVILIGLENSKYGFPSKIKENSLLKKITNINENKYAEERRLFYVAVTRTKNKCYLIANNFSKSKFVKELSKDERVLKVKKNKFKKR